MLLTGEEKILQLIDIRRLLLTRKEKIMQLIADCCWLGKGRYCI